MAKLTVLSACFLCSATLLRLAGSEPLPTEAAEGFVSSSTAASAFVDVDGDGLIDQVDSSGWWRGSSADLFAMSTSKTAFPPAWTTTGAYVQRSYPRYEPVLPGSEYVDSQNKRHAVFCINSNVAPYWTYLAILSSTGAATTVFDPGTPTGNTGHSILGMNDANHDGHPDVFSRYWDGSDEHLMIFLADAEGLIDATADVDLHGYVTDFNEGDWNGDGWKDALLFNIHNYTNDSADDIPEQGVYACTGFTIPVSATSAVASLTYLPGLRQPASRIGDLDGDGKAEVLESSGTDIDPWTYFVKFLGHGETAQHLSITNITASISILPDVTGDGKDDVVVSYNSGGTVWWGLLLGGDDIATRLQAVFNADSTGSTLLDWLGSGTIPDIAALTPSTAASPAERRLVLRRQTGSPAVYSFSVVPSIAASLDVTAPTAAISIPARATAVDLFTPPSGLQVGWTNLSATRAQVSFTAVDAGEALTFNAGATGITVSDRTDSGSLSHVYEFTGSGDLAAANLEAVLASAQYRTDAGSPTNGERTVSLRVWGRIGSSSVGNFTSELVRLASVSISLGTSPAPTPEPAPVPESDSSGGGGGCSLGSGSTAALAGLLALALSTLRRRRR